MEERYIEEDWTSKDSRIVPPFNGYSPSGNVTGELVRSRSKKKKGLKFLISL